MPKVPTVKRFRSLARQSLHPFSAQDHETYTKLQSSDLIVSITQHLNNDQPMEKVLGAEIIQNFLGSNRIESLTDQQWTDLVQPLANSLLDKTEIVRVGAMDALCYLSSLSDIVCDILINNGIIEKLIQFFSTFTEIDFSSEAFQKKNNFAIHIDGINLLTTLCGTSSNAIVKLIGNKAPFVAAITKCLQVSLLDKESFVPVIITAVECLGVISEDEHAYSAIVGEKSMKNLLTEMLKVTETKTNMKFDSVYLQSLIISIALIGKENFFGNLSKEKLLKKSSLLIGKIFNQTNIEASLEAFLSQMDQDLASEMKSLATMQGDYLQLRYYYLTRRNCLETLTNMTSIYKNVDDGDGSDVAMNSDDDEGMQSDMDEFEAQLDPLIMELINWKEIFGLALNELKISTEKFEKYQDHLYGSDILALNQTVKIVSLSLIHNIVAFKFAYVPIADVWPVIYQLAFQSSPSELRQESINLVRELYSNFRDINITSEDLQSLYRLMAEEISPITKVNIIRIIALVASRQLQHKANHTQFSPILEQITTFFLESYQKESKDLVFRAEVLDSLIDIYAEDEQITLELIRKLNLISVLRNIATDYLKEMNENKELVAENVIISTVGHNLQSFIDYKQEKLI